MQRFSERQKFRPTTGGILLLTALSSLLLVGLAGLVTDAGLAYYRHARIQGAVNAGWKAGNDWLKKRIGESGGPAGRYLTEVRAKVQEVLAANGLTPAEIASCTIRITPANELEVIGRSSSPSFFAGAFGIQEYRVAASRSGPPEGASIIPLAIPHGVVKDLTRTTYSIDFFDPTESFATGTEYILKLGSGGGNNPPPPTQDYRMILIPMDAGSQSETGFQRAYGVVFWCLKIDDNDPGYVPAYWLLGYRGGSFLLNYDQAIIQTCNSYGVNYTVVEGRDNIQAIFNAVNPNVLELYNRPRIAVYSSQDDPDPVEQVLQTARIPYGTYGLPPAIHSNGWTRTANYNASRCNRIYDGEIIDGALQFYHWVHLHHEDFTGFNGGCSQWLDTCKVAKDNGRLGPTSNTSQRNTVRDRMCSYCRGFYNATSDTWAAGYNPTPNDNTHNCANVRRRCCEKATYTGVLWQSISGVYICQDDPERPQCREWPTVLNIATSKGFTDDANSRPKPQYAVYSNGTRPLPPTQDGWFNRANRVQKMKWEVARRIKEHVQLGGFLFAQCFAPETLDLSLWQRSINQGQTPTQAYNACMAFTGFSYMTFPRKSGATWYSNINSRSGATNQVFTLTGPSTEPRIQNHASNCDTGQGHTASFITTYLKPDITILGRDNSNQNWAKYIWGSEGSGTFTFLGGHYHYNVQTKRLVLNNVLLGSLVEKDVNEGGNVPVVGKQKNNYGVIDPDNFVSGGANDYRDRLKYGFNQPLQLSDRIIPEPGNQSGPTDQGVSFRVFGDSTASPSRRVIVPITDIPPEVPINNPHNANAAAIYDIQGQDHPNGVYSPDQYNFGSSVRIIGFAEFELLDPSEYTRAGANIQSGDSGDLGYYQTGQVRGRFIRYIVKPGELPVN
jgi:hypothetical protein